jgi:hypothetical protein
MKGAFMSTLVLERNEANMTDFQFKAIIKMIRQTVAAKIAAGEDPSEILKALDELLDNAEESEQ